MDYTNNEINVRLPEEAVLLIELEVRLDPHCCFLHGIRKGNKELSRPS